MKNKLKKTFKFGILIIGIFLLLLSCERQEDAIPEEVQQEKTMATISFNQFKSKINSNSKLESFSRFFDISKSFKSGNFSKIGTNISSEVTISTDDIIMIKKEEFTTYTFTILTPTENFEFYNLVLYANNNQEIYKSYILKYTPSEKWLSDTTQHFSGNVKIVTNDIFDIGNLIQSKSSISAKVSANDDCISSVITSYQCSNNVADHREGSPGYPDCTATEFYYYITVNYEPCSGSGGGDNGDFGPNTSGGTTTSGGGDAGIVTAPNTVPYTFQLKNFESGTLNSIERTYYHSNSNIKNTIDNYLIQKNFTDIAKLDAKSALEFGNSLLLNFAQFNWAFNHRDSEEFNEIKGFLNESFYSQEAKVFAKEMIDQMILDQNLTFEQAVTIAAVNTLSNPITGDPIEFYLLAQYKNSNALKLSSFSIASNSIQVGAYTLTPHYKSNGTLVFYTAARWNSTGNGLIHDIEYIIKPSGLSNFQQKIDLYTAAANLFYLNGTPTQGQISMAAGDYVTGLKDMWADALTNPQYYLYLAHVFVGVATNLNAVESTSTTFEGKIKFTSQTSSSNSKISIDINNRSYTQYRQMIQDKFPNSSWTPNAFGEVELFLSGNIKYVGRFQNSSGYAYVIEYWKNGLLVGKFRFFY